MAIRSTRVEKITAFFTRARREHGRISKDVQLVRGRSRNCSAHEFLNHRYRIESVPVIVVNGKYKTDVGMAGGEPQLFKLIDELPRHENGG